MTNKTNEDGVFGYGDVYKLYSESPPTIPSGGSETIKVLYNIKKYYFLLNYRLEVMMRK